MNEPEGPGRLYTIVCAYDGGTYLSQVTATGARAAAANWAEAFREERPAPKGSRRLADDVLGRLGSEPPVAVQGLAGVWCVTAVARGKAALIHIIISG